MDSIPTRAPFAKPTGVSTGPAAAPSTPNRLIPGGIEIGSWRIAQVQAPMSNSAETDECVLNFSLLLILLSDSPSC